MTRLDTGTSKPNGLAVSPDGKTLYVADSGPAGQSLVALDLDGRGNASRPRTLHEFGKGRGIDGMTVTTDGRVVAAAGSGVYVFSPEGKALGVIPVPEAPANVEFGGPGGTTLYIMAGTGLYRVETTMKGFRLWPRD